MTHCLLSESQHARGATRWSRARTLFDWLLQAALMAGCAGNARTPAPLLAQPPMVSTSTIEIALNGVKQSDGDGPIHIALWGSERTFMKDGEWVRGVSVAAADASKITAITDLAPGRYAISSFHDTTNCGSLRRNIVGIPRDPWAFSNGGSSLIPPSWKRASFVVCAGTTRIELDFTHAQYVAQPTAQPTAKSAQESPRP